MENKQTTHQAISIKRWIQRLLIGSLTGLAALIAIGLLIISTNIGSRFALRIAARQSPVRMQIGEVRGNLLTGIYIRQLQINQIMTLNQIKLTWQWQKTLNINAHIQKTTFTQISPNIIDALPDDVQPILKQSLQMEEITVHYKSATATLQLNTTYYGQNYNCIISPEKPNTVIINSGEKQTKLAIAMKRTDRTHMFFAHGAITLPGNSVFKINEGEAHFHPYGIDLAISGQTNDKDNKLDLSIQSNKSLNARVNLKFTAPQTTISATGNIGKNSNLNLIMNHKQLNIANVKGEKSRLSVLLSGDWQDPMIEANYSAKKLQIANSYIDDISLSYQSNDTKTNALGAFSLKIKELLTSDSPPIEKITLQNTEKENPEQFQMHAKQGAYQLDATLTLIFQKNALAITIQKAMINQYQLFDENTTQTIHIRENTLSFQSHKKDKGPSVITVNGNWLTDGPINLKIQIRQLETNQLPLTLLRKIIPSLDRFNGNLDADLLITRKSSKDKIKPTGTFRINIREILLNHILENIPLDSSLLITGGSINGEMDSEVTIEGDLHTEFGPIKLSINSSDALEKLTGTIQGTNINIGQSKSNQLNINIQTNLQLIDNQLKVDSNIYINHAEYRLDFYRPITFLPFEAIIYKKAKRNSDAMRFKFNTNIDLGQNTNIHVIGFHGQLKGKLVLSGSESVPTLANGSVILNDGTLVIYKQSLPINRLTLTWFNSPVIAPDINLSIMAKSLRTIDGRDQMQQLGLRAHGPLNNLRFDYFATPAPMNSFQIITALLTDSSFMKKSNKESLDKTLAYYHNDQRSGQLTEILEILNAIKGIPFFDNIDISEINFDNMDGYTPEINGVTITKRLDKYFSVRYRVSPSNQRNSRISIDTSLSENLILTNFIQNEGDIGIAINYSGSK